MRVKYEDALYRKGPKPHLALSYLKQQEIAKIIYSIDINTKKSMIVKRSISILIIILLASSAIIVFTDANATLSINVYNKNLVNGWENDSNTNILTFRWNSNGPWLTYGTLTTAVSLTSWIRNNLGSVQYYEFNFDLAALFSKNQSSRIVPTELKLEAYMNSDLNSLNNSSEFLISLQDQLQGEYEGVGQNISSPTLLPLVPEWAVPKIDWANFALDAALGLFDYPFFDLIMDAAIFNYYAASYDESLNSNVVVHGTNPWFATFYVKNNSHYSNNWSFSCVTGLTWSIPANELTIGHHYILTLVTEVYDPYMGVWNSTTDYLQVENSTSGGGIVVGGGPILNANGYIPIDIVKTGSAIQEYDFQNGAMVSSGLLYETTTNVIQIERINN